MAQSAAGQRLIQLGFVSTAQQRPTVPPDPDSQAEALLRPDDLKR